MPFDEHEAGPELRPADARVAPPERVGDAAAVRRVEPERLVRVAVGELELGELAPGATRVLSDAERQMLLASDGS